MSLLGSFYSFMGYLGQQASQGASWLYSNTIGAASTYFQQNFPNLPLTAAEWFVTQVIAAVLSIFGYVIDLVNSTFGAFLGTLILMAKSLGLFGTVAAFLMFFFFVVMGFNTLRKAVEFL